MKVDVSYFGVPYEVDVRVLKSGMFLVSNMTCTHPILRGQNPSDAFRTLSDEGKDRVSRQVHRKLTKMGLSS